MHATDCVCEVAVHVAVHALQLPRPAVAAYVPALQAVHDESTPAYWLSVEEPPKT